MKRSLQNLITLQIDNIINYIFPKLYMISLFITGSLCLFIPFTCFTHSYPLSSANHHLFPVSITLFVLLPLSFLKIPCKWNQMVFVFLWLILLSIIPSSIQLSQSSFFMVEQHKCYVMPLYIYTYVCVCVCTTSSYPFFYQQRQVVSYLDYC